MPSWRDKLGPAKFKGVEFHVDTSERQGGRRIVSHDYPFKDDPPFVEDMGRKARVFRVEAFVLGSDYFTARDQLLEQLESNGAGELIHPYYGTRRVVPGEYSVRETTNQGGVARFSIEFHETSGDPVQPSVTKDGKSAVRSSASVAQDSVAAEFIAVFNGAATHKEAVIGALQAVGAKVTDAVSKLPLPAQTAASLVRDAAELVENAATMASQPTAILESQVAIFEAMAAGIVEAGIARPSVAMLDLYHTDFGDRPPDTTAARALERANFDALTRMTQRVVVIQAALIALEETFPSYEDAVSARENVTDLINEQSTVAEDDSYPSLYQLRADLVDAIPGDDSDLPRLLKHTPRATLPSLVLAHRLYGDVDDEQEVIDRNRIRHPGFVTANRELEILSRG